MAPKTLKRKSDVLDEEARPTTPTGSPSRKRLRITETQKQALIDNLQLEITERARKLRAHYALQCADLRSRVERRVNRIPMAMRKMMMGELMAQHAATGKPTLASKQADYATARDRPLPPLPQERTKATSPIRQQLSPPKARKRKSSQIRIAADQENDVFVPDTLPVAKKTRGKTAIAPARATSRAGKPVNVLSPRSHNSRTLPQSPIKQLSPFKSAFSRPTSPLKPISPFKSAASAATNAISASMHGTIESTKRGTAAAAGKLSRNTSREKPSPTKPTIASTAATRGKMLPPPRPLGLAPASPQRSASQSSTHTTTSDSSVVSSGTTVVKPKRGTRAAAAAAIKSSPVKARATRTAKDTAATKSTAASAAREKATTTTTGTALRGAARTASKKVPVTEQPAATGRRVLRKRD